MTLDTADTLAFRIGELMRADSRIATLAHGSRGDPDARAAAILEAIADRKRTASVVLETIAREDRALQSGMTVAAFHTGGPPGPGPALIRRDRSVEALVNLIETQSCEYNRIARRLETARQHSDKGPDRVLL
jgi:hypothetical protein